MPCLTALLALVLLTLALMPARAQPAGADLLASNSFEDVRRGVEALAGSAAKNRNRTAGSSARTGQLLLTPPHFPVLTLKLPQESGERQSEIRSREPSR